jgi:nitroreductase
MKKIKNLIFRISQNYKFYKEGFLDYRRYFIFSYKRSKMEHLESDIVRLYHVLEKGLSMTEFRPRFGQTVVEDLILKLKSFELLWKGLDSPQIMAAKSSLKNYLIRHQTLRVDISDFLKPEDISQFESVPTELSGVRPYEKQSDNELNIFLKILRSRTSLRSFDHNRIPAQNVIRKVVEAALSAPSVCNRQTARIYAYTGEAAQRILSMQNGCRGFRQNIPLVMVVTCDMRYFVGSIERYQPWIDGGIFGMSLLLALHGYGLGAVPLNWAVTNERDRELRKVGKIRDHDRIIMLVGCGYPQENAFVTASPRRSAENVLYWNN